MNPVASEALVSTPGRGFLSICILLCVGGAGSKSSFTKNRGVHVQSSA